MIQEWMIDDSKCKVEKVSGSSLHFLLSSSQLAYARNRLFPALSLAGR